MISPFHGVSFSWGKLNLLESRAPKMVLNPYGRDKKMRVGTNNG